MYTINIKDHGKEIIDKIAINFTEDAIKDRFPKRTKCFVAIKDNKVVGTISLDKLWGDDTGKKYIILTVFVHLDYHSHGIGKLLLEHIEEYAKQISAEELIIPASVHARNFYMKYGYDYMDGIETQNEEKEYMLSKTLTKKTL